MFAFFERLVDPYPEATPATPPRGFFAFLWACSQGLRKYLLATTLLTAVIGAFEALLFAFLGNIVDWLSKVAALATVDAGGHAPAAARRRARRAAFCWSRCSR